MDHDAYRAFGREALKEHLKDGEWDEDQVDQFLARLFYVAVDAKSDRGWADLKALLDEGQDRVRAFYLAVGPALFGDISERIRATGLVTGQTRIVVEKPIGRDLQSAKVLNRTIGEVFEEEQVYRIDHYLGKGNGAEPDGAEVRQCALRAIVEFGPYRPCADHRGGIGGA